MSSAVVRAVADTKGVDPTDLDECLYDYVDPCALDRLFDTDDGPASSQVGRVSFTMADCRIRVEGTRKVVVTSLSDRHAVDGIRS